MVLCLVCLPVVVDGWLLHTNQVSSSLPKRRAMNKAKVHGKAHRLGSAQHRFEINRAAAARKRPASADAAKVLKRPAPAMLTDDRPCRHRGRPANPVHLRRLPDPVRDEQSGIPLTQLEVVNYPSRIEQ